MGTSSTEGIARSTLSLVFHCSHKSLCSPVNSLGEFVSEHGVVKEDIFAVFLPDGVSHGLFLSSVVLVELQLVVLPCLIVSRSHSHVSEEQEHHREEEDEDEEDAARTS